MKTVSRLLLFAPAALLITACTATEPRASHRISLSAAIGSPGTRAAASRISADLIIGGSGESVRVTSAQMVLSRMKLESIDSCSTSSGDDENESNDSTEHADSTHDDADSTHEGADSTHHDADSTDEHNGENHDEHNDGDNNNDAECPSVRAGPVLVDLPLDGTTKVVLDALVPAGTYTALKARLDAVDSADNGAAEFLAAHPDFEGISVKVVGVFKDTSGTEHPFTFISRVKSGTRMKFDSPVTVGSGTMNLTIDVDVSSWFTDESGAVIDPTNPENQKAIERNIRASLRAFEDDNHDGDDDHHEGGEEGGH